MFEMVVSITILLYVMFAVIETNYLLKHGKSLGTAPSEMKYVEVCFEAAYMCEVLLRLFVHRSFFFIGTDKWWNMFDVCMLIGAIGELILSEADMPLNPMFLRFLRAIKIGRKAFRVVRLTKYVSDLNLMTKAFLQSLLSLTWCVFLLVGFITAYGLFFGQQFAHYLATEGYNIPATDKLKLLDGFGSVQSASMTLLKCISGGMDWGSVYSDITRLGTMNMIVFISYIVIVWLSLSNIITSIFLDKAMHLARPEANTRAMEQFKNNLSSARELAELFHMIAGHSETIDPKHHAECLSDVRMATLFESHGLDVTDIDTFLELLVEEEGASKIHIRSFVNGCLSLKGFARSIDLLAVKHKLVLLEVHMRQLILNHSCDTKDKSTSFSLCSEPLRNLASSSADVPHL